MPTEETIDDTPDLTNDCPDTLRIMISTDNHLGYAEKDNVRGMDSFAAFEEVLYLSRRFNCDMVLLAGDLFHDNRPSRRTLHKTMEILRRYCMGPAPVRVQVLSADCPINYQDPNYAVQLPIFSIHGNHDDPSRDPGSRDLLAALDLLSVSNLINYFGRQEEVDKVEVSPVLIQKGETKVALYGLGSVRDERLNRMWTKDKVRFLRPPEEADEDNDEEESEGYFNIFTLHQNRDLGRGNKNCVQETMIPPWMDIVVWGHEHECLIDWVESVVGTFRISQPGSSVATSLVSGEAARKQVGILDIRGHNFRMKAVPLTQVRAFVTTEISLREHRTNLDPDDPNVDKKVATVLDEEVQLLMMSAKEKRVELLRDAKRKGNDAGDETSAIKYKLKNPEEVLVRVRVDHNGFTTLSNQRFGAKFIGSVANPGEILLFHRKKDIRSASTIKKKKIEPIAPDELERTNMEDLVKGHLESSGKEKLEVLGEQSLSGALEDFVDKSRTAAIAEVTAEILEEKQHHLLSQRKEREKDDSDNEESFGLQEDEDPDSGKKSTKRGRSAKADDSFDNESENAKNGAPSRSRKGPAKKEQMTIPSSSDDEERMESQRSSKPSRKTAAASRKKVAEAEDDIEEDDDSDFEKPRSKRKKPTKKHTSAAASGRKSSARKKSKNRFDDSDSDEYDGDDLSADWGTSNTRSQLSEY